VVAAAAYRLGECLYDERTATPDSPEYPAAVDDLEHHARRHGFKDHAALGMVGHFVHMGAMLFPVLAAELIPSAEAYRKTVRIASVVTTVAYEGLYTFREARRRDRQDAKLVECRNRE
jgi:hypothetical protein